MKDRGKTIKLLKKVLVVVSIVSTILLMLLACLLIVFMIMKFSSNLSQPEDNEGYVYRFRQQNKLTNESSVGFIHMLKPLGENEYIFSDIHDDGSELSLISDFDSYEYSCTGHCYCDDDDVRRRGAIGNLLRNKVFYVLLAATTSFIAYRYAVEYYVTKCNDHLSEICSNALIRSEFEGCEQISQADHEEGFEEYSEAREGGEENQVYSYYCSGKCKKNYLFNQLAEDGNVSPSEMERVQKEYDCERLELTSDVSVGQLVEADENYLRGKGFGHPHREIAKYKFVLDKLNDFCFSQSLTNIGMNKMKENKPSENKNKNNNNTPPSENDDDEEVEEEEEEEEEVSANEMGVCIGVNSREEIFPVNDYNPTIQCVEREGTPIEGKRQFAEEQEKRYQEEQRLLRLEEEKLKEEAEAAKETEKEEETEAER